MHTEMIDSDGEVSQTALMHGTITNSAAVEAVDYNDSKPPIPVESLKFHIDQLSANDNYFFSEEYQVRKGTVSIAVYIFFGLCDCVYVCVCVCVALKEKYNKKKNREWGDRDTCNVHAHAWKKRERVKCNFALDYM